MPDVPVVSGSRELTVLVADAFAPDGALARLLPAFEPRPGQRTMASAVAGVLEAGGILLAEAGTGTGKTLAYLIPAILHGKRLLVSTGTKNLQEQIYTKDVPVLRRALGVPFTATCMKGRGNYLCLHRFDQFRQEGVPGAAPAVAADRVHLTLIEDWLTRTDTGDRAEIDELPDDLSFWSDIAATTENCLGSECPRYGDCFITRMRQRAAESDVVIVNHHLLCADAAVRHHSFGEVIPECHILVIDEAHQLEEIATQYFGITVSNYRFDDLIRDALRALRAQAILDRVAAKDVVMAVDGVERAARAFFSDLQWRRDTKRTAARRPLDGSPPHPLPPPPLEGGEGVVRSGRQYGQSGQGGQSAARRPSPGLFDERVRLTPDALDVVGEAGLVLTAALDALDGAVRLVKEAGEDLQGVGTRAAELRDQLRFLLRIDDEAFVYFLEIRGRGVFLKASPIDVSSIVGELLLDRMHATVLTSATLAVNGSFGYVRGRLGVARAEEVRLPSEFDYARQSLLYLPRRMPDPRDPAFTARVGDEVIEVLRRTEGRAFVLFTSYAAMRAIEPRVAEVLPYPLFVQGSAPRHVLLERFKQTSNAVLLATSSFWQGVDVAGEALSCVIIDKLPFASPGDPITAARIEAINARGGDAFGEYQVPLAILSLLQGLGRLLRHRSDRGILAILDPRLQTMGYGRRFLASLPASPVTRNLDDIEQFFQRGV